MMDHEQKRSRELAICQMLADGCTRKEAAARLNRTRMTVDQTMLDLKRRHKVATDAALVSKLMREGLIR